MTKEFGTSRNGILQVRNIGSQQWQRKCANEGCDNRARDGTGKYSNHGGCKRCTIEGCDNGARDGTGKCSNHGGGKRCEHADHIVCELEPFPHMPALRTRMEWAFAGSTTIPLSWETTLVGL